MLDHVFTDAIGALRDALEQAFLERQAFEERFQTDVLLGDLTWQTSYGVPGEGSPPRVRADLTLDWSTWSQTAYRSWYLQESLDESPHIDIEVVFRVQNLETPPLPEDVLEVLPLDSPLVGSERLHRSGPTLEATYSDDLSHASHAIEVSYDGSYSLGEDSLADGSLLDGHFSSMGGWISSTLVRLGDLNFVFIDEDD